MESEQGETTLSPVEVIRDLIRECYRLEHAGKMNLALQRGEKAERLARSSGQNDLVASALAAQAITWGTTPPPADYQKMPCPSSPPEPRVEPRLRSSWGYAPPKPMTWTQQISITTGRSIFAGRLATTRIWLEPCTIWPAESITRAASSILLS
jgi:hypothetical protein